MSGLLAHRKYWETKADRDDRTDSRKEPAEVAGIETGNATSHGSYTVRIHMHLDQRIDAQKLRIALDKTAQRYPYFCVSLKRNEREFYYEVNSRPIASGLEHVNGKGLLLKLMIPEESFLPFVRSNDGTPGIMLSILIARAIERIHPQHEEPLISNYVVNARPMLKANETFHNCTNRVVFHYDDKIRKLPLERQCTAYRGKSIIQADEEVIIRGMTIAGSMAQMILDIPDFSSKAKIAMEAMAGTYDAATYMVSYVGRWKYPQLGRHIREFWTEAPVGPFPLIEVAAVNGKIFVSFLQPFSDRRYYDALIDELKENGIEYVECGTVPVCVADIKD